MTPPDNSTPKEGEAKVEHKCGTEIVGYCSSCDGWIKLNGLVPRKDYSSLKAVADEMALTLKDGLDAFAWGTNTRMYKAQELLAAYRALGGKNE